MIQTNKPISIENIINARIDFNRPRDENEENLIAYIQSLYDAIDMNEVIKTNFVQHPDIIAIKDLNPISQRVIINKYLSTLLYMLKTITKVDITEILIYLMNDGTIEDWKINISTFVIPAIKEYEDILAQILTKG